MIALTHLPSPNIDSGQRTHVDRTPLDYPLALHQHAHYRAALLESRVDVRILDVNGAFPDGVFIEDTAIVLDEIAVLASMGAEARRGEVAGIERELAKYREVARVTPPAKIEGGDVLRVGRMLLVGESSRTDMNGIRALEAIVGRYGYQVRRVSVRCCLHLKTACTALPDGRLLINPAWLDVEELSGFEHIAVPDVEPWGANVLCIVDTVCAAAEHAVNTELLRSRGYSVRTIPLSEFAKAEGGVTCLSLLIS
jgi:dimethylargininase